MTDLRSVRVTNHAETPPVRTTARISNFSHVTISEGVQLLIYRYVWLYLCKVTKATFSRCHSSLNALYKRRHNSAVKYMQPIQPTLVILKTYMASGSNLRSDKNIIIFICYICSPFNDPVCNSNPTASNERDDS